MSDERVYVALDLPNVEEARAMVERLGDSVISYKVGLQLLPVGGGEFCRELKAQGKNVFADFKLHDIGATVEKAARSVAGLGVDLLTVHARPQVMAAAAKGGAGTSTKVLGVTVLTSLSEDDLHAIGHTQTAEELIRIRALQAVESGIHGVVASPLEAAMIRAIVPEDFLIVTPGVRPVGADAGDQKRVATPADAIRNGASHIVVGRPITQNGDPKAAAEQIIASLA
jgi:orotidine-5'-phosphate decarboxylase